MRRPSIALSVLAAVCSAALTGCTAAADVESAATAVPDFASPSIVVYDDNRSALFKADRGYTLAVAGNPEGTVFGASGSMVRITPDGVPGLWLSCADLEPGLEACAQTSGADEQALQQKRSLPACPGDPRCPKRNPPRN